MAGDSKNSGGGWLFKQEPDCYSFADLERDGSTTWDGVRNPMARQNLHKVRPGDRVLFYHTGKDKAVVGEMRAESAAMPDPVGDDPKAIVVKVKAVKRWRRSVTLAQIKADPVLAGWDLARLPRL